MDLNFNIIVDICQLNPNINHITYSITLSPNNNLIKKRFIPLNDPNNIINKYKDKADFNLFNTYLYFDKLKHCLNILIQNIKINNIIFNFIDDLNDINYHINIINSCLGDNYHLIKSIGIYNNNKLYIELLDYMFNKFTNITKIYQDEYYEIDKNTENKLIPYLINNHNIVEVTGTNNNKIKLLCEYNKSIHNTLLYKCIEKINQMKYIDSSLQELVKNENQKYINYKQNLIN